MKSFLKKAYKIFPENLRNKLLPIYLKLEYIINNDLKSIFHTRLNVFHIKGKEKSTEVPLTLVYFGNEEKNVKYWAQTFFSEYEIEKMNQSCWIWNIRSVLKKRIQGYDFLIAEVVPSTLKFFKKHPGFVVPEWVPVHFDLAHRMQELKKISNGGFPFIEKKIKKHQLSYETSTKLKDLQKFYDNMYVPYMSYKHHSQAVIREYNSVLTIAKDNFFILFLSDSKKVISGLLITFSNNEPVCLIIGVNENIETNLKQGAIGALYYFAILELQKQGYKKLHYGAVRPFLDDPITYHKLALGAKFSPYSSLPKERFWIQFNPHMKESKKPFLKNYSFLHDSFKTQTLRKALFLTPTTLLDSQKSKKILSKTKMNDNMPTDVFLLEEPEKEIKWENVNKYKNISLYPYSKMNY